jgi:hypothetical protein
VLPFKNAPTQGQDPERKLATLVKWQLGVIENEMKHSPYEFLSIYEIK